MPNQIKGTVYFRSRVVEGRKYQMMESWTQKFCINPNESLPEIEDYLSILINLHHRTPLEEPRHLGLFVLWDWSPKEISKLDDLNATTLATLRRTDIAVKHHHILLVVDYYCQDSESN